MAISWGAWEYSGGNGMRVGIDVDWEAISHAEAAATATIKIYTENEHSYGDGQTLNFSGSIGGSQSFTNSSSGGAVLRETKSYVYDYPSTSYGSSPGSRSFTATLSGAYNGVTPSKTVTSSIPARPYGVPDPPTNATVMRVSDASNRVTWSRHPTAGEPYNSQTVQRWITNVSSVWTTVSTLSGLSTVFTDSNAYPNRRHQYRVKASNSEGSSAYDTTGYIWTSPAAPNTAARNTSGANQVITWVNAVGYSEYLTQVWHAADGVWDTMPVAEVAAGTTTYTHVAPAAGVRHKYRLSAKTTTGPALISNFSAETTETAGSTSPPAAPSGLTPSSGVFDPTLATVLSWTHSPTDGSSQAWFQVRHRKSAVATWTTAQPVFPNGTISSWTLPANTYVSGDIVEWQVMTWGADPGGSVYSNPAVITFATAAIPPPVDELKLPLVLDLLSGEWEAVKGTGWTTLTLGSGWVAGSTAPAYKVYGNVVYLRGSASRTSGAVAVLATLASGARPPQTREVLIRVNTFAQSFTVTSGGALTAAAGYVNGDVVYLDAIPPFLNN